MVIIMQELVRTHKSLKKLVCSNVKWEGTCRKEEPSILDRSTDRVPSQFNRVLMANSLETQSLKPQERFKCPSCCYLVIHPQNISDILQHWLQTRCLKCYWPRLIWRTYWRSTAKKHNLTFEEKQANKKELDRGNIRMDILRWREQQGRRCWGSAHGWTPL